MSDKLQHLSLKDNGLCVEAVYFGTLKWDIIARIDNTILAISPSNMIESKSR